jgi:putative two-component system response regulator
MMHASDEKKVILAIDDMPSNLIAIKNILEPMFDVRLVKAAGQALSLLGREKIDLVLLDIEMPGYNGFELSQAMRADPALAPIPVIFVTTHASPNFVRRAAEAGAKGYILKPFKPSLLLQKVLEQLGMDAPTARQDNTYAR